MIAATHVAIGVATGLLAVKLAENIGQPQEPSKIVIALIAGTLSHYILDAIPHKELIYDTRIGTLPVLAVELFIITIAIFSMTFSRDLPFWVILSGFIGGAWPDFIPMAEYLLGENKIMTALNGFHDFWHSSYSPAPIPSMIFQLSLVIIPLYYLRSENF